MLGVGSGDISAGGASMANVPLSLSLPLEGERTLRLKKIIGDALCEMTFRVHSAGNGERVARAARTIRKTVRAAHATALPPPSPAWGEGLGWGLTLLQTLKSVR
ncbi:MAG: hypothetical protein A2W18_00210 [Candidatus Muproteobacteria bacterium RBG_16_60_9]|uniref:Uncharacterized protein n=1 Tax=Candidatus Muproteobacteria bacterium RBG_16_60_9 TaxID=1817755 RepID=A0A1F6V9T0_9PROT|nr:MAG: hypothetical protein A2W18_00210 [Candidatus Muproteobacteria bacterium RBG_16_60_9]